MSYIHPVTCNQIAAEIATFPSRDLSRSDKHDLFWHFVSTEYFYVLYLLTIAASDFLPLKILKSLLKSHGLQKKFL